MTKNNSKRSRRPKGRRLNARLPKMETYSINRGAFRSPPLQTVDLRGARNVVPSRVRVELPYVTNLVLTSGAGYTDYLFNLNSLFDPDRTGTGHQPLGYDQWATFYGRYRVLSCKAVAFFQNISTDGARVSISGTNSTTALTLLSSSEQPLSASMQIGGLNGNSVGRLHYHYDCPRVEGKTSPEYLGSDVTQAAFGSNPTELCILHVFVANQAGGTVNVQVELKLLYDCVLFDALELSES